MQIKCIADVVLPSQRGWRRIVSTLLVVAIILSVLLFNKEDFNQFLSYAQDIETQEQEIAEIDSNIDNINKLITQLATESSQLYTDLLELHIELLAKQELESYNIDFQFELKEKQAQLLNKQYEEVVKLKGEQEQRLKEFTHYIDNIQLEEVDNIQQDILQLQEYNLLKVKELETTFKTQREISEADLKSDSLQKEKELKQQHYKQLIELHDNFKVDIENRLKLEEERQLRLQGLRETNWSEYNSLLGKSYRKTERKSLNKMLELIDGIEPVKQIINTSAYTEAECDKVPSSPGYGITASGKYVKEWYTIAAGPSVPFGTVVYIPYFKDMPNDGYFIVEDRGGAISNNHIDVYMKTIPKCNEFGRRNLECYFYYINN